MLTTYNLTSAQHQVERGFLVIHKSLYTSISQDITRVRSSYYEILLYLDIRKIMVKSTVQVCSNSVLSLSPIEGHLVCNPPSNTESRIVLRGASALSA